MPAMVAIPPEKPPLQKKMDSAVLYMADVTDQQVENNYSRWQVKRAKICACTVVLTTLILVAGTLGAITIVLQAQQHSTDKAALTHAVPKEPLHSGPNSPQRGPYPNPPIKIDNGGLWPAPKNPVTQTPDLVAVDGEGTVLMSLSPKPDRDGTISDSLPDEYPVLISDSSHFSSSDPIPYHERSYVRRTYISSSFPYDGYYARGGVGVPSPSISGDSDLEGSAKSAAYEINDIPVGSHNSLQQDINIDSGPGPDVFSVSDDYSESYPYIRI
ncbi:uncharacterized protein LOC110981625 [Acanthaster planci]|uniref:Uncharacterized protein LOC110981625 n=1 Tax=Acanthaster planci TaxID=133434 RepID=A0A8B7YRF2_ACAPL|nr:uncharacterized protein LOC110981625 [Acanthaster planci]